MLYVDYLYIHKKKRTYSGTISLIGDECKSDIFQLVGMPQHFLLLWECLARFFFADIFCAIITLSCVGIFSFYSLLQIKLLHFLAYIFDVIQFWRCGRFHSWRCFVKISDFVVGLALLTFATAMSMFETLCHFKSLLIIFTLWLTMPFPMHSAFKTKTQRPKSFVSCILEFAFYIVRLSIWAYSLPR